MAAVFGTSLTANAEYRWNRPGWASTSGRTAESRQFVSRSDASFLTYLNLVQFDWVSFCFFDAQITVSIFLLSYSAFTMQLYHLLVIRIIRFWS